MRNILQKKLTTNQKEKTDKHKQTVIYKLQYDKCDKLYTGKTGRNFKTTFEEHLHNIKYNKQNSRYAKNILDTEHMYGTLEVTEVLKIKL
jgi:hypothetical protein